LGAKTDGSEFVSVAGVLRELIRNPVGLLLRRWNWKSCLLSSFFRAAIFFFANLAAGWRAALAAMSIELLYRGLSAGFCGAHTGLPAGAARVARDQHGGGAAPSCVPLAGIRDSLCPRNAEAN
jgi:hypothetical protein